jgi:phosphoglycerol transferase
MPGKVSKAKTRAMININSTLKIDSAKALPLSLSTVIRSDWKWWLFGALFSFVLASVLMSGWPEGLLPNLDYPFVYSGDGLWYSMQTQRAMEGWVFDNLRSGFPFGSNYLDYPASDAGNFLILKIIGLITGEFQSAINLYFFLSFSVTFVVAFCVLRTLGLANHYAFTAALLFNFIPFHFQRIGHLFFTWYFVVPVFYYIALKFSISSSSNTSIESNLLWKIFYGLCLVGLGSFGVYYALFGLILFFVVASYGAAANYSPRALKSATFACCMVLLGVFLNLAPNLVNKYTNGTNLEVAQRSAGESELYGFKFAQLILPRINHRNSKLAEITSKYNNSTPLVNENITSTLGALGALGLLASFWIIFSALAGRSQNRILIITSLIILVLIMFGTIGGFGSIFALVITPAAHGWNRISVFISFGVFLVFFLLIQTLIQKRFTGQRLFFVSSVISIFCILGGLWDQTIFLGKAYKDQIKNDFHLDKAFVGSIEKSLPVASAIYQIPYMAFPEVPELHHLGPYDLMEGFLHSTRLRWSYGGMKGRSGDLFYRSLAKEPLKKQLDVLKRLGFAGIYVDRRGLADNDHIVDDLTTLLGISPSLTRADGSVVFFRLNQNEPLVNLDGLSPEQLMKKAGYIVDRLGVRYDATYADGIDFTRQELPIFIKDIQGLSGSEPWGRWSDANLSPSVLFDFREPLPMRFNMVFSAQPFGPNTDQDLVVKMGTQIHHFKMQRGQIEYQKTIDLEGQQVTRIEFLPPMPASPQELNMSSDNRKLGIGLIHLRFEKIPSKN